jgi:hypothetical protein
MVNGLLVKLVNWSIGLIILSNYLNPFQNDSKVAYFDGQKRALSAVYADSRQG